MGLLLSTDGVPVFKSSSGSLWPIYLSIANLPPAIRYNSANTLICGLWFGPKKPPINALIKPVIKMLRSLYVVGTTMLTPAGIKTIRAKLLTGIFDLVAKAPLLNMKQFNGKYGCSSCTHPGTRLSNNSRIYLPAIKADPRTHQTIMAAAKTADTLGTPVMGIKGISVLSTSLDLVNSIPVDYMHAVLEGVARLLLRAWFDSENHREAFYLGRSGRQIDDLLLQQRPPHEFTRPPRSVLNHRNYWKASELRNWLLFYSLPILMGHLPPLYLHHYALLVCAIHILLQESLTTMQINAAESMLSDFVALLPELYGERSCTINTHLLTHLAKYVRLWGPLWTHSAFGFESKNGHRFHSRSAILDQLVFNMDVQQTLKLIHPMLQEHKSEETLEILQSFGGDAPRRNMRQVGDNTYTVGKVEPKKLSSTERQALQIHADSCVQSCSRMFHQGTLYHSTRYAKGFGKRDSTICSFLDGHQQKFGQIQCFCLNPQPIALVLEMKESPSTLLTRAGNPCREVLNEYKRINYLNIIFQEVYATPESMELKAIPVSTITGKAIQIHLYNSNYDYVLKQPNNYEHH